MSKEEQRKALIAAIWEFIKEKGADKIGSGIDVRLQDIEDSVFLIEGELRISGEVANNFSGFYVNYYEFTERWSDLVNHLSKKGWMAEWYNPAYIIAYEEVGSA